MSSSLHCHAFKCFFFSGDGVAILLRNTRSLFTGAWAKMSTDYFDLAGEGESPKHNQEANHPSTIKRRTTQTESGGELPKHNQEADHSNTIRKLTTYWANLIFCFYFFCRLHFFVNPHGVTLGPQMPRRGPPMSPSGVIPGGNHTPKTCRAHILSYKDCPKIRCE